MIDSNEYKVAPMKTCQTIVFACSVLLCFDYVDAFLIQRNFNGYRQHTTIITRNRNNAAKSIYLRNQKHSRRDMLLYEQSVTPLHNEVCEESNVLQHEKHMEIEFQSQPNAQVERFTDTSSEYPQSSQSSRSSDKIVIDNRMSDLQMRTLKSKISKYMAISPNISATDTNFTDKPKRIIILWRNLLNDTPELTGYPISFLSEQMKSIMRDILQNPTAELSSTDLVLNHVNKDAEIDWDQVLPYIDAYTFEVGGGVTGLVYGVTGVADGNQICTTSVGDVQTTIPRNYIQTGDGCIYELGRPAFSNDLAVQTATQSYSLSGTSKAWFRDGKETASLIVKKTRVLADDNTKKESFIDSDLLQLAGLTTLVLTGAMAMETLSHHLTVNVFWV
jgi:hypothetical protein